MQRCVTPKIQISIFDGVIVEIRKNNGQVYELKPLRVMHTSLNCYLIDSNYVNSLQKLCTFFLYFVFPDVNLKSSNKVLEIKCFIVLNFHDNLNKAKAFRPKLYI